MFHFSIAKMCIAGRQSDSVELTLSMVSTFGPVHLCLFSQQQVRRTDRGLSLRLPHWAVCAFRYGSEEHEFILHQSPGYGRRALGLGMDGDEVEMVRGTWRGSPLGPEDGPARKEARHTSSLAASLAGQFQGPWVFTAVYLPSHASPHPRTPHPRSSSTLLSSSRGRAAGGWTSLNRQHRQHCDC